MEKTSEGFTKGWEESREKEKAREQLKKEIKLVVKETIESILESCVVSIEEMNADISRIKKEGFWSIIEREKKDIVLTTIVEINKILKRVKERDFR